MKGEFGFTLVQSSIPAPEEKGFDIWRWDNIEKYKSGNVELWFGTKAKSNVQGMEMVVPKSKTSEGYQVFILADLLSKQELEKILLSLVKQ